MLSMISNIQKCLAEYFETMPWYSENQAATTDIYDYLNEYEQANMELLRFCQDRKEGKAGTVGNGSIFWSFTILIMSTFCL